MGHHDDYVFNFLHNKKNAREFFSEFMPPDTLALLCIDTLERDSPRLPNNESKNSNTDLFFSFLDKTLEQKIFTLFEHKSHIKTKVFRQIRNQLNAAEEAFPDHLIIPILFYHGEDILTLPESLQKDKKKVPLHAQTFATEFGLNFKPIIINARTMPPPSAKASVSIRSFIQALIRYNEDDPQNAVQEIVLLFKNAPETEHELKNFELLLKYVPYAYDFKLYELAEQVGQDIPPEFRSMIMTAAQQLEIVGIEKGIKMNTETIARKLLAMGKSLEETREITGLTREQMTEAGILFG